MLGTPNFAAQGHLILKFIFPGVSQHLPFHSSTCQQRANVPIKVTSLQLAIFSSFLLFLPLFQFGSLALVASRENPAGESSFSLGQEAEMSSQCSPLVPRPFLPGLSSAKAAAHPGRAFPHPELSGDCLTVVSGFRVRTRRREGAEGPQGSGRREAWPRAGLCG